jgi:hypothetical protein
VPVVAWSRVRLRRHAVDDQRAAHPLQARERVAHVGVAPLVSEPRGDIHFW